MNISHKKKKVTSTHYYCQLTRCGCIHIRVCFVNQNLVQKHIIIIVTTIIIFFSFLKFLEQQQ